MRIESYWYQKSLHPLLYVLLPLSSLFSLCVSIRHQLYRYNILKSRRFNIPVIVVGNITVGGTGKTPFVIWLAKFLQAQGYKPGIVSRGVGGKKQQQPHLVKADDAAAVVGDEALLLQRDSGCPVVLCIDRAAAVQALLQASHCDVVISDDGLQHYRLKRDMEIVIIDGIRRLGNEYLLPAGPLREPVKRMRSADFVVVNGGDESSVASMELKPVRFVSVRDESVTLSLTEFSTKQVHATAAIGHPERFFSVLRQAGFSVQPHVFPDHHLYQRSDLDFNDSLPILMTAKDAVKCAAFADERHWYLEVSPTMSAGFENQLLARLNTLEKRDEYENDFNRNCKTTSRRLPGGMQCDDTGGSGQGTRIRRD
jgi:tetraacyldisaccharide 4'-kinase